MSVIIEDQNHRGALNSGITGTRLAKAHQRRAESIINGAIELRRASIQDVPELAGDEWFGKLATELV